MQAVHLSQSPQPAEHFHKIPSLAESNIPSLAGNATFRTAGGRTSVKVKIFWEDFQKKSS
jgi:hypothetical protein